MLDINSLLDDIKKQPYIDISIRTPHTGYIEFTSIEEGSKVKDVSGEFKEIPGTKLAIITREKNPRFIHASQKGILQKLHTQYDKSFVNAGVEIAVIRHFLTKEEVVSMLLQKALHLFTAPERAKYYFIPEIDKKVKISGSKTVTVSDGMDLFIVSRMKREVPLAYHGPDGIIYQVYFKQNQNMDIKQPLIGICPPEQLQSIEEVISYVNHEWKEQQ